jgi:hypothetical protein
LTEYVRVREPKSDLFVRLAERGFDDRFVAVEATARERELAGVMFEASRAACNEKTGLIGFVGCDDDGDGGRAQARIGLNLALETR